MRQTLIPLSRFTHFILDIETLDIFVPGGHGDAESGPDASQTRVRNACHGHYGAVYRRFAGTDIGISAK
jgi:hypothetical protein